MKLTPVKDLRQIAIDNHLIDEFMIMEAINCYNQGNFLEMTRLIDEYEPVNFFRDMYAIFNKQPWRSQINKYLNFVGITIEYQDIKIKGFERIKEYISDSNGR